MEFYCTRRQRMELESLAYWIADINYINERYGYNDQELKICRDTIEKSIFPSLDKLNVPFWVQNAVICWAENWREYKGSSTKIAMQKIGIYF